jgi:chemotaxis methyl-accepting protein methylase
MRQKSQDSLQVDALSQLMHQQQGLDISVYAKAFLVQTIDQRRAEKRGMTLAEYEEYLSRSPAEAEALCQSLHVCYSEFFRHPLTFALLEQHILPALIAEKKQAGGNEIRVWSAGCAAGQEAWSVAILLDELCGAEDATLDYRIFATDVSEPELRLAREGMYNAEAIGNISSRHLQTYFSLHGDAYAVVPRLRTRVDFSRYDLLDEHSCCPSASLYGDFDLILCCNLLFYYRQDIRQRILDKVCRALAPGGYLVVGEADRAIVSGHQGLCAVNPPVDVFKKR